MTGLNRVTDFGLNSAQLAGIAHTLKSLGGIPVSQDANFDNNSILQNALNTLPAGSVILLTDQFRINSGITIKNRVHIIGHGVDTGLLFYGSGAAITLGYSDYSNTIESIMLKNFFIDGGNSPSGQDNFGVVGYRALYCEFDLKLNWFNKTANSMGIKLDGGYSTNSNYFCATNTIVPRIGQCSTGIFLDNCCQNTLIFRGVVDGYPSNVSGYTGININDSHSQGNIVISTDVEDCQTGIRVNGTQNQFLRPRVENCTTPFLQDTSGYQNTIVAEWGIDSPSNFTNNGGSLKVNANGFDQLSQLVQVISPASGAAAELDIKGGSGSQSLLKLFQGNTNVFYLANAVGGAEIQFWGMQADNALHEFFGMRNTAYIPLVFLKGALVFDNNNAAGDVSKGGLFINTANGKLSIKNQATGNINQLERVSGNATMAASTTSITVTHGCGYQPTNVLCTAQGNIGNVWVTTINSTQFTINCATAPASNTTVSWEAY